MIYDKKATSQWTMTKLISFILLIIILVLVIYGVSQGQMKPLLDRVGAKFDDVLIWLGLRDIDSVDNDCYVEKVISYSGGEKLVEEVGAGGLLTFCREYCQVDFEDGKGSFKLDLKYSTLGKYKETYVVESGAWMVWAQFFEKPTKKIYFSYFGEDAGWKWSPDGSSFSDWFSVSERGSIEIRSGSGMHASRYIVNEIMRKLVGESYEEGVVIIRGSLSNSNIKKVYTQDVFVDIEHEVLSEEVRSGGELYDAMLKKSRDLKFESQWRDNDGGDTYSGTMEMWIGWKGLTMEFSDKHRFAVGPENGGNVRYLWELPSPDDEWVKRTLEDLRTNKELWRVNRLNLYYDLLGALNGGDSNWFEFNGRTYRFSLMNGGPDNTNILGIAYSQDGGRFSFYGLDWENSFWAAGDDGWEKQGSQDVYEEEARRNAEINKKIKDFLQIQCRL